jgi:hypothetical protein
MTPLSAEELGQLIIYATIAPIPPGEAPREETEDVETLLARVDLPKSPKRRHTVALLTYEEFKALPEYSLTDPTGGDPALRWKRDVNTTWEGSRGPPSWWLCEYRRKSGCTYIVSKKIIVRWTLEIAAAYVDYLRAKRKTPASAAGVEGTDG